MNREGGDRGVAVEVNREVSQEVVLVFTEQTERKEEQTGERDEENREKTEEKKKKRRTKKKTNKNNKKKTKKTNNSIPVSYRATAE